MPSRFKSGNLYSTNRVMKRVVRTHCKHMTVKCISSAYNTSTESDNCPSCQTAGTGTWSQPSWLNGCGCCLNTPQTMQNGGEACITRMSGIIGSEITSNATLTLATSNGRRFTAKSSNPFANNGGGTESGFWKNGAAGISNGNSYCSGACPYYQIEAEFWCPGWFDTVILNNQ